METNELTTQKSFTPTEVAKILGMKPSSIYALISRGYLQANRVGKRRQISSHQLDQYLRNRGHRDHVIDLTKQATLLSDNLPLQGLDNPILLKHHERMEKQWL
jgi:excisionase family DNA binding protein